MASDILRWRGLTAAALTLLFVPAPARAYVEAPLPLGAVVQQSVVVCAMVVTKVDRQQNLIIYQKTADLKGKHPHETIKHTIGRGGLRPGEWQEIMNWAEPGKPAVFFHNGSASETYIGPTWYQAYPQGEWWGMSHGEPFMLRSYAGKVDKLPALVADIVAGKEVIVPCMLDGDKEALHKKAAKVQRMKVSLKLLDYNPKRDFAGWGGEDIRRLAGMPGFDRFAALGRVDAGARSASAVDFNGDGKPDLCLTGTNKVSLLINGGDSFTEVNLPNLIGGARAAVWADYAGTGRPGLFLATPRGPRLYANLGKGTFRDDTRLLPVEPGYHLTAAAWADFDGDGKPDLAVGNGFHGLRLYKNTRPAEAARASVPPAFGPWHAVGPFRDTTGAGNFAYAFAPEADPSLTKKHKGKRDMPLTWVKQDYKDGAAADLRPFGNNCATYLQREITAPAATDLPVALGGNENLTVWLNGEKRHADPGPHAFNPEQTRLTLKLKAGKNLLLLKVCHGDGDYRFQFTPGEPLVGGSSGWFADVTGTISDGPDRVDSLSAADFTGDGKPDLLVNGRVYRNDGGRLVPLPGGVALSGGIGPAAADFDGDGHLDLLVPQPQGGVKLYRNDGRGTFANVTPKAGDLVSFTGQATGAAWGDVDGDGRPDLLVTVLRGPNRFYRNAGDGAFTDASAALGITNRVFNSQAAAWADLNGDGRLDLVLANEGQESAVLFGTPAAPGALTPVVVVPPCGSAVTVTTADGKRIAAVPVSGDGRGGAAGLVPRFTLAPGEYTVTATVGGKPLSKAVTVAAMPLTVKLAPETP